MHTKNGLNNIELLFPKDFNIGDFIQIPVERPFSVKAVSWLNALAIMLKKDKRIIDYPDVATFSFFCRASNLIKLKRMYYPGDVLRLGRGTVFHIPPSNMPTSFAYSLVSGILSGNRNIIKVSSKKSEQADMILRAIWVLSKERKFQDYSSRMAFLRCDLQSSATAYFSSICDVRIIWGGDSTINEIRKNSLRPRAFDVTFASRYSLCIINADKYIHEKSDRIVKGFYNDTYLFDQNACTSPHLIIWLGTNENVVVAKRVFWSKLYELVKAGYHLQPYNAVDKLTTFYHQAIHLDGIKKVDTPDNLIWRIELRDLPKDIDKFQCTGGYFSEYKASSLSELSTIITDKYQTLSWYGLKKEDLVNFVARLKPSGIDRIVPIGRTTDFSLTWDGFNLIETLSREVNVF